MQNHKLKILVTGLLLWVSIPALSQINLSRRHVVILQEGVDVVWGSYMFVVENQSKKPEKLKFELMMPKEMIDWRLQQGLMPEDVKLSDSGSLVVEKDFQPGPTVVGIGFNAPAKAGQAELSFTSNQDVTEFMIMAPKGQVSMKGDGLEFRGDVGFSNEIFDTLNKAPFKSGETVKVSVSDLAEGRQRLWVLGGVFAFVMLLAAVPLALKTRPDLNEAQT